MAASVGLMCALLAGLLVAYVPTWTVAIGEGNFYSYGLDRGDSVVDITTAQASLSVGNFRFYGRNYDRINVNLNGVLSVGSSSSLAQNPTSFPSSLYAIIAPFWTRAQFTGTTGKTYYRLDDTSSLLSKINTQLRDMLMGTTWPTVSVTKAVVVTWKNLQNEADSSQTNTFQCVLAMTSSVTYVLLHYDGNRMMWAGQSPALVGFNAGDGNNMFVLPTSQTADVLQTTSTGNTKLDGRWLFRVDGSSVTMPGAIIGFTDTHSFTPESHRAEFCVRLFSGSFSSNVNFFINSHNKDTDNDDYASRSIPFISYLESSPEGETLCRNIHIKDDVKYEKDEQFSISLTTRTVSDLTAFLPGTKTIVIQDNDDVFVTYGDVTVVEEDGTAQLPVFLVMRETGQSLCVHNRYMTQREVQVSYFTADGTARAGIDYQSQNSTLTIPPRSCEGSISVPLLDDDIFEENENFTYTVFSTNPNVTVNSSVSAAIVTITDRDSSSVVIGFTQTSYTVTEGETAHVCVRMTSGKLSQPIVFTMMKDLSFSNNNEATDGSDFQHIEARLEFSPNTVVGQSKCVNVATRADSVFEGAEETHIFIKTSSPINPSPAKSLIRILDANTVTVTMVNDTFVYQEGTPSHRLSVCVSMTGTIERDLTIVTMATEGTAKFYDIHTARDGDFQENVEDITFEVPVGQSRLECRPFCMACGQIIFQNDFVLEEKHETFLLELSHDDPNVHFLRRNATVTIVDNSYVELTTNFNAVSRLAEDTVLTTSLCVTRRGQTDLDITVTIATYPITATDGVDYIVGNMSILIPASRRSESHGCGNLSLTVLDDAVVEGEETFTIFLSTPNEPSRVMILDSGMKNVTIEDDDHVSVIFNETDYSVLESEGLARVCVQMTGFSATPLMLLLTPTAGGSATGSEDYGEAPVSVTLPPSSQDLLGMAFSLPVASRLGLPPPTSGPICAGVPIISDDVVESETIQNFFLNLSSPNSSVVVATPSIATVYIEDDDRIRVELEEPSVPAVTEGSSVQVCARLQGRADFGIRAVLRPVGVAGSAKADLDFAGGNYTVVFPALSTEHQCVSISSLEDSIVEREEGFRVELLLQQSDPRVLLGPRQSVNISIVDDDDVEVGFDAADYTVVEGEGIVMVCANMTGLVDTAVTVSFNTAVDATAARAIAESGTDFVPVSGHALFVGPSDQVFRRQCVNVSVVDDEVLENTEQFQVQLSSPNSFVRLVRPRSVVYLLDNDGVRISLEQREVELSEAQETGGIDICVSLVGLTQRDIPVTLTTQQGTASAGSDYSQLDTVLTFAPSAAMQQRQCARLMVMNDDKFEDDESFSVDLSVNAIVTVSYHIARTQITILDDDTVTLALTTPFRHVAEGNGSMEVCVELDGSTERNISYTLNLQDRDAERGGDYSEQFQRHLVFPPSADARQTQCHTINITDDNVLETSEQFTVTLVPPVGVARMGVGQNRTIITIIDDDQVSVKFVQTELEIDEDSPDHNVSVCILMEGVADRGVAVDVKSNPESAAASDFEEVMRRVTFTPAGGSSGNHTQCFYVHAVPDKLVEGKESFSLVMTSQDSGVYLENSRAVVVISDKDVVCVRTSMDTSRGYFTWPTTFPKETASVQCENGQALRYCTEEGKWDKPVISDCYVSSEELFRYLLQQSQFDKDSLRDLLYGLLQMLLQNRMPELRHVMTANKVLVKFAEHVQNGSVEVDTEIFGVVLEVVDILNSWPQDILKDYSSNIILSQEKISEGLFDSDDFSSYSKNLNLTAFYAKKATKTQLFESGSIRYSFGVDSSGNMSVFKTDITQQHEASIELPFSLRNSLVASEEPELILSFYSTNSMFPLEHNASREEEGLEVTSVVAAAFVREELRNLTDNVVISFKLNLGERNYSNVTCVSWDFQALGGQGAWVEDGCELLIVKDDVAHCSCSHLTNFACLVSIKDRVGPSSSPINEKVKIALSVLSVTGVCLSILGLVLTIVTLVVFNKLRKKDNTVFRLQLCLSMILMLVTFLVGIDRVEIFNICVLFSAFLHYFTLTSFLWMSAEAILMFHKLVFVFNQVTTRFLVIVSITCWLLPIPAVVIPIGINRNYAISESYCFISNAAVFFATFLGPILAAVLFNFVIVVVVVVILIKHSCNSKRMRDSSKAVKRRTVCRSIFSILGITSLVGLGWVFAAFTIAGTAEVFEFLFVGFNSLQGFFIFLFFVVFAKETQDLWLQACGCKEKKKRMSMSSAIMSSSQRSQKVRRVTLDENAERLRAMEEVDHEGRKQSNSWDIAFIVPQNQFDVFLGSDVVGRNRSKEEEKEEEDELKKPDVIPTKDDDKDKVKEQTKETQDSQQVPVVPLGGPAPTPQEPAPVESERTTSPAASTTDSGILMDNKKTTPSPTRTTPHHHHVHSASGIGYVSAESSLETLPQREEDCYMKSNNETIVEIAPKLVPRAVPNDYSRVHVEKV